MKKITFFVLCFFLLNLHCLIAQGWSRYYPLDLGFADFTLTTTTDGSIFVGLNATDVSGTITSPSLFKTLPNGEPAWIKPYQDLTGSAYNPTLKGVDNNCLLVANGNAIIKLNADGIPLWTTTYPYIFEEYQTFLFLRSDGYIIVSQSLLNYSPIRISKLGFDGNMIYDEVVNFNTQVFQFEFLEHVEIDALGNLFFFSGSNNRLIKTNENLDIVFNITDPTFGGTLIALEPERIIIGTTLINGQGVTISSLPAGYYYPVLSPDQKLFFTQELVPNSEIKVIKCNLDFSIIWEKVLTLPDFNINRRLMAGFADGGVVIFVEVDNMNPYLIRTDADGNTYTNHLYGNIFTDLNQNCLFEPNIDSHHAGINVVAEKGDLTWFATTDSMGDFRFNALDTGSMLLRVIPPGNSWTICNDSIMVDFIGSFDTIQINTGITDLVGCPFPEIDLATPFLRRCFTSTYTIHYENLGGISADSAVAHLYLDPYLSLVAANLPYIDLGNNHYAFEVGTLAPLQKGQFNVSVYTDCDSTTLGQIHCTQAILEITNPCPNVLPDFPEIQVTAECIGDSVRFVIKNIGDVPMLELAEFIVIEDLIVMRTGTFQLNPQQDTVLTNVADGSTYRIYAGHLPQTIPFFSSTAALEACNGSLNPGIWNMLYSHLINEDEDIDCQENIGAYDPNDKQAVPKGLDAAHYIAPNTPLEYTIRFQNTGTDTAFNIVVMDTVSPHLDVSSLRMDVSSHPFQYEILGNGVLRCVFSNIQLPDSNTNLVGSQGFVRFHILQKHDLSENTNILNRAAIFFDFNAPIFTNTTRHRINTQFLKPNFIDWVSEIPNTNLILVPNPILAGHTMLRIDGITDSKPYTLEIFDIYGRPIHKAQSQSGVWSLYNMDWSAGIYLVRLRSDKAIISTGKLLVE